MKVFLSSTTQDLVAYRQVADDTILRLSQQVVAMERFGPLPGTPVEECERLARESDVVICIVAHRYGFEPEKGRGSITRREVEAARTAGKDVLVWIVADDYPWPEKKEQDLLGDPTVLADSSRMSAVLASVSGLVEFKAWLRKTFVWDTFTTPDDLGRKIAVALSSRRLVRGAELAGRPNPTKGKIRIVHALQPALKSYGAALASELTAWLNAPWSPHRVWALLAAHNGKTGIVGRVLAAMQPRDGNVLVWSFYDNPDTSAFFHECNQLFLVEKEGTPSRGLERLWRSLSDGRPHLFVLDGLDRVQSESLTDGVRGEVSDQTLKLLLRAIAAGLGNSRALITSCFPLVDFPDRERNGYRETRLDEPLPDTSVRVRTSRRAGAKRRHRSTRPASRAVRRIFICYRRFDSASIAGRIYDRLARDFGEDNIFKDVDNIPFGIDFVDHLDSEVQKCDVLFAVIGPRWLHAEPDGRSRLDDANDFVRVEIAFALRRSIPVVPLLVDGAQMPRADQLPDEIKPLARRNGTQIRHDPDFHADMTRLLSRLG